MRLTHKHKYKADNKRFVFDMKDYRKACQKLGQLEDIEEELGIDLSTLFKATKEVWFKKTMVEYDVGGNWYKELDRTTIIHNSIVSRIDFQHKSIYIKGAKSWFYIKDYGKTWALTKEELL